MKKCVYKLRVGWCRKYGFVPEEGGKNNHHYSKRLERGADGEMETDYHIQARRQIESVCLSSSNSERVSRAVEVYWGDNDPVMSLLTMLY